MMHLASRVTTYFVGRLPISPRWTIVVIIIPFGRFAPIRRSSANKRGVEARQLHDIDRLEIVHTGECCTVDTERDKVFKRDFGLQCGHFNGHAACRVHKRHRVGGGVDVPVQLDRVPGIDRPRIAAEEAPHCRVVVAGAQIILVSGGVEPLAGVEVARKRIGDVLQQVAKRGVDDLLSGAYKTFHICSRSGELNLENGEDSLQKEQKMSRFWNYRSVPKYKFLKGIV